MPKAPAMPAERPYRSPKPIYSEKDYQKAMSNDFEWARKAAGVATDNFIRRNDATFAGQRSLIETQGSVQGRLQGQAFANQQKALDKQLGFGREQLATQSRNLDKQLGLGRDQIAASERMNSARIGGQERITNSAIAGQKEIAGIGAQSSLAIARQQGQNQMNALRQAGQNAMDQIKTAAAQRPNISTSGNGYITGLDFKNALAKQQDYNSLQIEELKSGALRGDQKAIDKLRLLTGGGSGGAGGAGGMGGSSGSPTYENPALAITRENNAAAAARQAAQIAAGDRARADQIASSERMQSAQLQYQREAPQIAANAEEDLRSKARKAALAVFNSARPGMTPSVA